MNGNTGTRDLRGDECTSQRFCKNRDEFGLIHGVFTQKRFAIVERVCFNRPEIQKPSIRVLFSSEECLKITTVVLSFNFELSSALSQPSSFNCARVGFTRKRPPSIWDIQNSNSPTPSDFDLTDHFHFQFQAESNLHTLLVLWLTPQHIFLSSSSR